MNQPFDEFSELLHELEAQMRSAEDFRQNGDSDGELLALSLASAVEGRMRCLQERVFRDVQGARADIAWREGNDGKTRRFSSAVLQATQREIPQTLIERLRAFAVGFDDARERRAPRTTDDQCYLSGHHLGLSALGN